MTPFPMMPIDPADDLADMQLRALSPAHIAALYWLRMAAWLAVPSPSRAPCSVPASDDALAVLTRSYGDWPRLSAGVRSVCCVVYATDGTACLRYPTLWDAWVKMTEARARKQNGALVRWQATQPASATPDAPPSRDSVDRATDAYEDHSPLVAPSIAPPAPETVARYAGVLCATARLGFTEHVDPKRRNCVPSLTSADPRNDDVASALLSDGVPVEFARDVVADASRTHKARGTPATLAYFAPIIRDRWAAHRDAQLALQLPESPLSSKMPDDRAKRPAGAFGTASPIQRAAETESNAARAFANLRGYTNA